MPNVFIAYRRDDTGGHAGRVYDRLAARWGKGRVTRDIEGIPPGTEYFDFAKGKVAASDCVLVLIGPRWLEAGNLERLHDPEDLHRVEIETALQGKRRVIPVLINGARMPAAGALPAGLRKLPALNAFHLDESGWDDDMRRLIRVIGGSPVGSRTAGRAALGAGAAGVALVAWLALSGHFGPASDDDQSGNAVAAESSRSASENGTSGNTAAAKSSRFASEESGPHRVLGPDGDSLSYYIRSDESVRFDGDWDARNIVRVRVRQLASVPGGPADSLVAFYRGAAPALRAAWDEIEAAGLMDRVQSFEASYVPRVRRRSTQLSNHATGLAFDINAGANRAGREPAPVGTPGSVRELVPIFEKHGFRWGGTFSFRDGGHFEWIPPDGP